MTSIDLRFIRPLFFICLFLIGAWGCGDPSTTEVDKNLEALPDPLESELRKNDWTLEDSLAQDSTNLYVRPLTDQD